MVIKAPYINLSYGLFVSYKKKGKLQIKLLKFGGIWILQTEVSTFGFYPLKFGSI